MGRHEIIKTASGVKPRRFTFLNFQPKLGILQARLNTGHGIRDML